MLVWGAVTQHCHSCDWVVASGITFPPLPGGLPSTGSRTGDTSRNVVPLVQGVGSQSCGARRAHGFSLLSGSQRLAPPQALVLLTTRLHVLKGTACPPLAFSESADLTPTCVSLE